MGLRNFIQQATPDELLEQLQELQRRLAETQETLRALQTGEADAIVVASGDGHRVYSVTGADIAYRLWIQSMAEGALMLSADRLVFFANHQFAEMAGVPLHRVSGSSVFDFFPAGGKALLSRALARAAHGRTARTGPRRPGS